VRLAERVQTPPPYLFAELDKRVAAKRASGADVISLGVGDPDLPTPTHIVEALREAAEDPSTHQYPSYYGLPAFRKAVADFYGRRFGVELDPDTEVQPLIGSKEGLAHLAWAFIDPGNEALVHRTINNLYRHGATVYYSTRNRVHVSGHASAADLRIVLNLVRPRFFVPIHGEDRHLAVADDRGVVRRGTVGLGHPRIT